jgi:hypothetical protein
MRHAVDSYASCAEWLEDVGPFDVALVLLGINDAAKGLANEFQAHYSSIVVLLAALPFKPEIILAKPLPILSREFVASSQVIAKSVEQVALDHGAPRACCCSRCAGFLTAPQAHP